MATSKVESVAKSLARLNGGKFGTRFTSPGQDAFLSEIAYGISTQSFLLDLAIGRPGYPSGRLVEIAGLESSSKSTLVLHALAQTQKDGGMAVLIETEQGFDTERAMLIGVNPDTLWISQPETMEEAFEDMERAIRDIRGSMRHKGPLTVAWDSLAATPVLAEVEGDYGDSLMGAHARVISRSLRKLVRLVAEKQVVLLFVNQLKTDLKQTYGGETHVTFGGKAPRFAASVRLEVKKRKRLLDAKKTPVGIEVTTSVIKNKIAAPFKKADYLVGFRAGINRAADLLDGGVLVGAITETSPGWFEYAGVKFQRSTWTRAIKQKLGGSPKVITDLYAFAVKEGFLKPYAQYSTHFRLTDDEVEKNL